MSAMGVCNGGFCGNGRFFPGEKPKNPKSKSKLIKSTSNPKLILSAKIQPQTWNSQACNFDFDFDFATLKISTKKKIKNTAKNNIN